MGNFLPSTAAERAEMLAFLGLKDDRQLYEAISPAVLLDGPPEGLPAPRSEFEVRRAVEAMAARNKVFSTVLRGAGAYERFIPAAVSRMASREEFVTAYTPYQAEISQGILQVIFEFQTMICELTGMDVSNASVYDGATAAAEGVAMCRERVRTRALVSACAHPPTHETIETYAFASNTTVETVPQMDGVTDLAALKAMLGPDVSCVYLQQPNFYGQLEDVEAVAQAVHAAGAKLVLGVDPATLGVLKSPGELGADVAVGEGQPLGLPLSWGGPYLGFMATRTAMMRKLPGRIVGETADKHGNRAFVLTLQAREQHIRREKASSNICSNQAHCALIATAYLGMMGPKGLAEVGRQSCAKAHWFAQKLCEIPGVTLRHPGEFFCEFVTNLPTDAQAVLDRLEREGVLGGLPVEGNGLLWCVTETCPREALEAVLTMVKEVCAR